MLRVRKTVNPTYGYYYRSDFHVYYEKMGSFEVLYQAYLVTSFANTN